MYNERERRQEKRREEKRDGAFKGSLSLSQPQPLLPLTLNYEL
jgi:hypothetical protein